MVKMRTIVTATCFRIDLGNQIYAILGNRRFVGVGATTDREAYRSIYRNGNFSFTITVLTVMERTGDRYACRQTRGRQKHRVRIVTEIYLEVHKTTSYVLRELDLCQHRFHTCATLDVDVVLRFR